jgi:hypothetical protein
LPIGAPLAEALERLDELIRRSVAAWKPNPGFFRADLLLTGPYCPRLIPEPGFRSHPAATDLADQRAFMGFLASMFEKPLREAFREAIEKNVPAAPAIATRDRPARLAAVEARRRELAQREEAVILSAEAAGLELDRKGDADPAIVLTATLTSDAA